MYFKYLTTIALFGCVAITVAKASPTCDLRLGCIGDPTKIVTTTTPSSYQIASSSDISANGSGAVKLTGVTGKPQNFHIAIPYSKTNIRTGNPTQSLCGPNYTLQASAQPEGFGNVINYYYQAEGSHIPLTNCAVGSVSTAASVQNDPGNNQIIVTLQAKSLLSDSSSNYSTLTSTKNRAQAKALKGNLCEAAAEQSKKLYLLVNFQVYCQAKA